LIGGLVGLKNCWEIMGCGREAGGSRAEKLGVCPAYPDFGHSCWGVAGNVCSNGGGTFAVELNCVDCDVYKAYERLSGTYKEQLEAEHPDEVRRFEELMSRKTYGFPRPDPKKRPGA